MTVLTKICESYAGSVSSSDVIRATSTCIVWVKIQNSFARTSVGRHDGTEAAYKVHVLHILAQY